MATTSARSQLVTFVGTAAKSIAIGCAILLATLGPVGLAHAQNQGGNGQGQNDNNQGVNVAATPELDSLWLFATGVAGVAGYALVRHGAKRRMSK
jgi:hypothetical protein